MTHSNYEIDITDFWQNVEPSNYSASVAEKGSKAAELTWNAAKEYPYRLLKTQGQIEQFKKHIREFGAWSDDEIASWTGVELNALFIQLVSGDMREASDCVDLCGRFDWAQYEERDDISHNLFQSGDKIYYSLM